MSSTLAYKMVLRLRWGPLALTLVSILLILMVSGVLASAQNISSYSTVEVARSTPAHYIAGITATLEGGHGDVAVELHRELLSLREKLRTGIADSVIVLAQVEFETLTKMVAPQQPPTVVETIRVGVPPPPTIGEALLTVGKPMIGSFYGGVAGVKIVEGAPGSYSVGLNSILVEAGLKDTLLGWVRGVDVVFNNVYVYTCDQRIPCPLLLLDPSILEGVISSNSRDVLGFHYVYMVNFSLGSFTVLAPESIWEASSDYDRLVTELVRETLEGRLPRGVVSITKSQNHVLALTVSAFSSAYN